MILITGSSGHLGEAICRTLKKNEINFLGIDIKQGEYTSRIGSITDREFVKSVVENCDFILHTASLHKPHVVTHSKQDFIDVNIGGTLNLLEEAKRQSIKGFIYTSTTSTFGDMLTPKTNEPAIWIDEKVVPKPKNIYGVTKTAAEDMCQLFYRNHKLPCIVLKTSRFFPEEDDKKEVRELYDDLNIKANEYLYRRVDIEDVVSAHLQAMQNVENIGFEKYVISATSPFTKQNLKDLNQDAFKVVYSLYPDFEDIYARNDWKMMPRIDRVYVNSKARQELNWHPKYDFKYVLDCLNRREDFRSALSLEVGSKAYHDEVFEEGPYPVNSNNS